MEDPPTGWQEITYNSFREAVARVGWQCQAKRAGEGKVVEVISPSNILHSNRVGPQYQVGVCRMMSSVNYTPSLTILAMIRVTADLKFLYGVQSWYRSSEPRHTLNIYCLNAPQASFSPANTPLASIRCSTVVFPAFNCGKEKSVSRPMNTRKIRTLSG